MSKSKQQARLIGNSIFDSILSLTISALLSCLVLCGLAKTASAEPVATVSAPLVDKLPDDRAEAEAVKTFIRELQEAELSAIKKVEVRTEKSLQEASKSGGKVKSAQYVVMSSVTVQLGIVKDLPKDAQAAAQANAHKPYKVTLDMKLVDLQSGQIANVAKTIFRGQNWTGWPTAEELKKPKIVMKTQFGSELASCVHDGCDLLLAKLPEGQ